jgi:hypothetical protein
MQCLEEISSKSTYSEKRMDKYRDEYMERYGMRKHYGDDDEFVRYY